MKTLFTCICYLSGTTYPCSECPSGETITKSFWCNSCEAGTWEWSKHTMFVSDPIECRPVLERNDFPVRCKDCNRDLQRWVRRKRIVKKMLAEKGLIDVYAGVFNKELPPRHLTITYPAVEFNPERIKEIRKFMVDKFKLIRRKVKMPYGYYGFEWVVDDDGMCNPHLHIIYWGEYIDLKKDNYAFSKRLEGYGLGRYVYIKKVYTDKQLGYAAKYVGKNVLFGERMVQTFGNPDKVWKWLYEMERDSDKV